LFLRAIEHHLSGFFIILIVLQESFPNEDDSDHNKVLGLLTSYDEVFLLIRCALNSKLEACGLIDLSVIVFKCVIVTSVAPLLHLCLHNWEPGIMIVLNELLGVNRVAGIVN
jgi:hypothetical protein